MIETFQISDPPHEKELSERLRAQPLAEFIVKLTVKKVGDEAGEPLTFWFQSKQINLERPSSLVGVLYDEAGEEIATARIDAVGKDKNETQNTLTLTVVWPESDESGEPGGELDDDDNGEPGYDDNVIPVDFGGR